MEGPESRAEPRDVLVVGGGPAGLSAALLLARARRRVVVCDAGRPRNAAAREAHGYLTRDGIAPLAFLRLAREDVLRYGVEMIEASVSRLTLTPEGFDAALADGGTLRSRFVLLATGLEDVVPDIPGMHELFGTSVHHCPYCDGWEWRDRPLAVYGRGRGGAELSHSLLSWSRDLVLCTDGPPRLDAAARDALARRGVRVEPRRIVRLEGDDGRLRRIGFGDGGALEREALFLATGHHQACGLARDLGCRFSKKGSIEIDHDLCTTIPRLYAAGDATRDAQFVVVAAAEGARAAVAINHALQRFERERELGTAATPRPSI